MSKPSLLLSINIEFSMMIRPPEFVPEYPASALSSIQAWSMVTLQTRWQAPTYIPESEK